MRGIKYGVLAAVAGSCLTMTSNAQAQVNINIGVAPDCPYGYYDVAPYSCAPAGYYGPEWFTGGVFVGAGRRCLLWSRRSSGCTVAAWIHP